MSLTIGHMCILQNASKRKRKQEKDGKSKKKDFKF
jgi:hypothetical protein